MLSYFYEFANADKTLIKVDKVDKAVVVVAAEDTKVTQGAVAKETKVTQGTFVKYTKVTQGTIAKGTKVTQDTFVELLC